jgi:hypothetical protein
MNDTNKLTKLGARRLLRLAKILDSAKRYDQQKLQHSCGTPACAWGHYVFSLGERKRRQFLSTDMTGFAVIRGIDQADNEFMLSWNEREELFGVSGCSNARTAKQAAKYIRAFVKRKGVE